jgi:hypothetical protein
MDCSLDFWWGVMIGVVGGFALAGFATAMFGLLNLTLNSKPRGEHHV